MRINRSFLLLLSIFTLALFLRVYALGSVPVGFYSDSIDVAYVGKYLVLNGKDPSGNILPVFFNKFDDFRPSGIFYLSGIFQVLFGSSILKARLITALFGSLTVFAVYFFVLELFKKREAAIFSSLFLAVLPWHIVLSRDLHEAVIGYFFTVCGFYFLLKYIGDKRRKFLILGTVLIFLSYFFYHGNRTLAPILLLAFWYFYKNRYLLKITILSFVISLFFAISPYGGNRLGQVIFYKSPGMEQKLQELPYADSNITTARVFHNKALVYTRGILSTWFGHFSPEFLFLKGGYPERYMVPEAGLAYFALGFVFICGMLLIVRGSREAALLTAWLLISPVQAALTYEDIPSVTRASFMIFPLVILGGIGMWWFLTLVKKMIWKKSLTLVFLAVLFLESVYFMHQYLGHQGGYKGILRGDGNIQISEYILANSQKYDLVLVPFEDNMPFYYLFLGNYYDSGIKLDVADLASEFQYQNVQFLRHGCPSHILGNYPGKSVLFVDEPRCEEKTGVQTVFEVVRKDLTVAWVARESK